MIYMDLVPIDERYRGISRNLDIACLSHIKNWKVFFSKYEKYLDWVAAMNNAYDKDVFLMLRALRDELNTCADGLCEIILYSDRCEELPRDCAYSFLGFDVAGDVGESAIQVGNTIDEHFSYKLNQNGLFNVRADAEEFCELWKQLIDNRISPWEVEINPRPFAVWACK